MKLLNIDEEIPEVFYVFIGQGNSLFSEINYHNYQLSKKLISPGINSLFAQMDMLPRFINGDIDYVPYIPNKTTLHTPSSHVLSVINGYTVEYALERWRDNYFKILPSRFSCLYAFGDWESCLLAHKYYNWDLSKVKKFKLRFFSDDDPELSDLDRAIKVCKCNMEIVTFMWNRDIQSLPVEEIDLWCKQYWCGGKEIAIERPSIETGNSVISNSGLLYEYLIEGILEEIKD